MLEAKVQRWINKAPALPASPQQHTIAEASGPSSASESSPSSHDWYPGNPAWVRLYYNKSYKRIVQEGVNAGILATPVGESHLMSCDVARSEISSPEAWARVLEIASLVTPDCHTLGWDDVDSSGLLTLYVERELVQTAEGRAWKEPEMWAKDIRPLETMAAEMRKLAPHFKQAVSTVFGRPSLVILVGRDALAKVIARAGLIGLAYKLNKSPTSSGFLEVTGPKHLAYIIPSAAREIIAELRAKYPGVVLIPSEIKAGCRVIAMTEKELTWRDSFFYTRGGISVRFYTKSVDETEKQRASTNKVLVDEAVGAYMRQQVGAYEAEAAQRGAAQHNGDAQRASPDDNDEATDATMAVSAQDVEDGLPMTSREGFLQELEAQQPDVVATYKKLTALLTACQMTSADSRATVSFVAQSTPVEAGHAAIYREHLQALTSLKDIPAVIRQWGRPDETAADAFESIVDRRLSNKVDVDGKEFGVASWANTIKRAGKPPTPQQSVTTTTTTTTVKKATLKPDAGLKGRNRAL